MKRKTTLVWFVLAAALAASIWILEHHFPVAAPDESVLLAGLRAAEVNAVQIIPAGAREISAARTNHAWQLDKPLAYPAQSAAIESLLDALGKISPQRLTAADMRGHKDSEYGFDNPQFKLDVTAGEQVWHLLVGKPTAPGDQVFVRVVGLDGAFVTDTAWLQFLPRSANDWRDTALTGAKEVFDWIVITNGAKVIELRREATNQLWRLIHPLAARADSPRIAAALQQLQAARVTQFVTDDPKADLSTFGLQPAELDLWLGRGTNFAAAVHAGKNPPDNSAQVYVRREGWNAVTTVAKETLSPWHGTVNDFRDPHLFDFARPVAEIEVRGENSFTLQRHGSNDWSVVGEKFPADAGQALAFLRQLADLRVSSFEKDLNTAADLQGFGLVTPARTITLRAVAGDTNAVTTQLLFGAATTNKVFAKRGDEDFVYALAPETVKNLPENGWEFRDRRVWDFSETNVVQLTLRQSGKTRQLLRTGVNKWSLAPGSQGLVDPVGLEACVQQLGGLAVVGWVARNPAAPEKFGLNSDNLQITLELKSGEKFTVNFGLEFSQTALASVALDGERWVGVLPTTIFQMVVTYLTIPANTP